MKQENKEAFAEIGNIVNTKHDKIAIWYKVNWVIVHTSHKICDRRGKYGHHIRQKFRKTNWKLAQIFYPQLRCYRIPDDIHGDSPCKIKSIFGMAYEFIIGKWKKKPI